MRWHQKLQEKAQEALLPSIDFHSLQVGFAASVQQVAKPLESQPHIKINKLPWRFRVALQQLNPPALNPPVWVHALPAHFKTSYHTVCTLPRLRLTIRPLKKEIVAATVQNLDTKLTCADTQVLSQNQTHFTAFTIAKLSCVLCPTVTISKLSVSLDKAQSEGSAKQAFYLLASSLSLPLLKKIAVAPLTPKTQEALTKAWQEPILRKALPLHRLPFAYQQQLKHNLAKRFQLSLEKIQLYRVYDRIKEQLFCDINVTETWQLCCLLKQGASEATSVEPQQDSFLLVAKQLTVPLGLKTADSQWLSALFTSLDLESED